MSETRPQRLAGLDIFRGLAVAGMIIVNYPGSDDYVWWPLDHAPWHGWTPTDMVFPAFLFAVGVALGLSFPRRLDPADRAARWLKIGRRVLALVGLGLGFTLLAHPGIATLRYPGVLQRIGVCYGLAATLALLTARATEDGRWRLNIPVLAVTVVAILIGYWAVMLLVPVPGFGAGNLSPEGNLAGYIDRAVFTTQHMWFDGTDAKGNVVYDPEGLLSTIPSVATVLIGMLAAAAWRRSPERSIRWIALAGAALLMAGLLLAPYFPINKRLWTSSFVLATGGVSTMLLALCTVATRHPLATRALAPFRMLGMNAILGFCLSMLLGILSMKNMVPSPQGPIAPRDWAFERVLLVVPNPYVASFLCAAILLAMVFAIVAPLHGRGIHLRL